uniref:NADH-ubiquinone oxidoreductase chain 3 n=1 Tax=Xenobates argentatus TaxID=572360 RepID=A0AB38Z6L7_9HEMI|nr:NADH dehydrogenase subunit 3 [Xenobates argentatus]WPW47080.1 NADH dehydrogenase subunit 3 [Xenobates argentatus]
MMMTMKTMIMMMMISLMLMMLCFMISKKDKNNREKMTPFECGFDPKSSSRMPFSMQFFMIAIIFLIFDVEIIIILPSIKVMHTSNMIMWFMVTTMFIIILILGLYYEWKNKILEWTI